MNNKSNEVVIVAAARTPIGRYNGSLKNIKADQLGTIVIREVLRRSKINSRTPWRWNPSLGKLRPQMGSFSNTILPIQFPTLLCVVGFGRKSHSKRPSWIYPRRYGLQSLFGLWS